MNQYNTQNVKLSNSQLNKLKPGIQKGTEAKKNPLFLKMQMMRKIFTQTTINLFF